MTVFRKRVGGLVAALEHERFSSRNASTFAEAANTRLSLAMRLRTFRAPPQRGLKRVLQGLRASCRSACDLPALLLHPDSAHPKPDSLAPIPLETCVVPCSPCRSACELLRVGPSLVRAARAEHRFTGHAHGVPGCCYLEDRGLRFPCRSACPQRRRVIVSSSHSHRIRPTCPHPTLSALQHKLCQRQPIRTPRHATASPATHTRIHASLRLPQASRAKRGAQWRSFHPLTTTVLFIGNRRGCRLFRSRPIVPV